MSKDKTNDKSQVCREVEKNSNISKEQNQSSNGKSEIKKINPKIKTFSLKPANWTKAIKNSSTKK